MLATAQDNLSLRYRHTGDIRQRFIEQVGSFVDVGFCHGEGWYDAQGVGTERVHQQAMFQRLLNDNGGEAMLDIDGLHEADAARSVDEVVLLAERLELGAAILAN